MLPATSNMLPGNMLLVAGNMFPVSRQHVSQQMLLVASSNMLPLPWYKRDFKGKGRDVRISPYRPIVINSPLKLSGMDHIDFTLQTHHACIYLVRVHQTALTLTVIVAI